MTARSERLGVLAAVVLAVSAFAFFGVAGATTKASPTTHPEQFLLDVTARPALASIWVWAQLWLGLWTVPFYLALHARLRREGDPTMRISLVCGLAWGMLLVGITPILFALFHDVAPAWAHERDPAVFHTATALLWIATTQITIVFFFRAISVFSAGLAMIARGGAWSRVGWLGVAFGVEHVLAGVGHQVLAQGGVNSALGAVGGMMLFVWLLWVGRLLHVPETTARLESVTQS